ncbi:hypothetical protein LCGC14_1476450, partial [marine sediment metagenome]
ARGLSNSHTPGRVCDEGFWQESAPCRTTHVQAIPMALAVAERLGSLDPLDTEWQRAVRQAKGRWTLVQASTRSVRIILAGVVAGGGSILWLTKNIIGVSSPWYWIVAGIVFAICVLPLLILSKTFTDPCWIRSRAFAGLGRVVGIVAMMRVWIHRFLSRP